MTLLLDSRVDMSLLLLLTHVAFLAGALIILGDGHDYSPTGIRHEFEFHVMVELA